MAQIFTWSMPALTITMTWICIVWCLTTRSVRIVNMDKRTVGRQQTSDSNLCLLTLEAGLVVVIAIATYFLFSAHKASSKETKLVDGWPHLGTCTFVAPLSDSPFLALFFTLFATSIVTADGGVYCKFIHKTEAVAYLRKHKMKLSKWIRTSERRMLFSLASISLLFTTMFIAILWVISNNSYDTHEKRMRGFFFCRLTSCHPEECDRYVGCKRNFIATCFDVTITGET